MSFNKNPWLSLRSLFAHTLPYRRTSQLGPSGLTEFTLKMPPVNIPDGLYIARLIAEMSERFGSNISISVMDLRHWFHQIRIPESWRPYFAILLGSSFYAWKVLPMGWTASPYLAQAMAFGVIAVILHKHHGISFEYNSNETIPHHLKSTCRMSTSDGAG